MTLCTLSALLLASPFAADLLDLTARLVPRLLEAARLIQEFRAAGPTPEGTARFEQALQRLAREVCREVVAWVYNRLEPDDPARMPAQLGWQGEWYRRRVKSANRALATLFGAVTVWRYRYEPLEAGLRSIFPLEIRLGVEAARATPALAERVGRYTAGGTQQAVLAALRREHGVSWSVATLRKVVAAFSAALAEHRAEAQVARVLELLRQAEASAGRHRPTLAVGRDGVFVPLRGPAPWREGATATVSVLDRRGRRLGTVYLGRMPEAGQATLSAQLTALLVGVLRRYAGPPPRLEYITDGGHHPDTYYGGVLRRLGDPRRPGRRLVWVRVIDFYHACQYVGKLAEALFGPGRAAQAWAAKMRRWLRDKRHGAYRVLHSAAALHARWELPEADERGYAAAYDYLRKRLPFMGYAACRGQGLAIGSGVTEAACKTVFTQRLKQSGMSWEVEGGQAVLDLRVIALSGVWDAAHRAYLASRPVPHPATGAPMPRNKAEIAA